MIAPPAGGWRAAVPRPDPVVPAVAADDTARSLSFAEGGDRALAVWLTGPGTVVTAHRTGSRWSGPRALSPPGSACTRPVLALRDGRAVAGWVDDATRAVVREGTASGDWGASVVLSGPWSGAAGLRVAVSGGAAVAVWTDAAAVVRVAESPRSGCWHARILSGDGEPAYAPAVAAAPDGVAVAWLHAEALVRLATRPAGGPWAAPVTVTPQEAGGLAPSVAAGEGGALAVVWPGEDGHVAVFLGRLGTPGGALHDLGEGWDPRVAWRDGAFVVEWEAG